MSIPSYQEMKRPILEYLVDVQGPVKLAVLREGLAKRLGITEKGLEEQLPSGGKRFSNRVGWAVHELKDAGLVESVRHGYSRITQSGRGTLRNSDDASRKLEQAKEKNSADDERILDDEKIKSSLVEMAVEGWRFSRLFSRLLDNIDADNASRYVNQLRYFRKKVDKNLEDNGLRMVNIEGHAYDPGIAASAINIADFGPDDHLVVDQMVEPIIMDSEGVRKMGTVMLRKVEK